MRSSGEKAMPIPSGNQFIFSLSNYSNIISIIVIAIFVVTFNRHSCYNYRHILVFVVLIVITSIVMVIVTLIYIYYLSLFIYTWKIISYILL